MLVAFLVFGMIGVWYCNEWFYKITFFPQGSASVEGENMISCLCSLSPLQVLVFVITQILLFWFAYKYQEKDDGVKHFISRTTINWKLLWTTVPAIVLMYW